MKTNSHGRLMLRDIKGDTSQIVHDTSAIKQDTTQIQGDMNRVLFEISQLHHLVVQSRTSQAERDPESHDYILARYLLDLKSDAETVLGDPDNLGDSRDADGDYAWEKTSNTDESPNNADWNERGTKKSNPVGVSPIMFTNSQGRRYPIPFANCKTWAVSRSGRPRGGEHELSLNVYCKDMSKLIRQSFAHSDDTAGEGGDINEGKYDLTGPGGEIILPSLWEGLVRPGLEVTMKMWKPKQIEKPPIRFKDAVGRKFSFPFQLCETWAVSPPDFLLFVCSALSDLSVAKHTLLL